MSPHPALNIMVSLGGAAQIQLYCPDSSVLTAESWQAHTQLELPILSTHTHTHAYTHTYTHLRLSLTPVQPQSDQGSLIKQLQSLNSNPEPISTEPNLSK